MFGLQVQSSFWENKHYDKRAEFIIPTFICWSLELIYNCIVMHSLLQHHGGLLWLAHARKSLCMWLRCQMLHCTGCFDGIFSSCLWVIIAWGAFKKLNGLFFLLFWFQFSKLPVFEWALLEPSRILTDCIYPSFEGNCCRLFAAAIFYSCWDFRRFCGKMFLGSSRSRRALLRYCVQWGYRLGADSSTAQIVAAITIEVVLESSTTSRWSSY